MSVASAETSDATVAVAVGGGGRSRRAVHWAAENLIPHARRVLLVHVIPSVSSVPSPSGQRTPIEKLDREVVNLYVDDLKSKAQQGIYPLKKLCRCKDVETLVLDGASPAAALTRFLLESGTKNLVLGSSSLGWIRRIFKGPNVPATILKSAPDSCNIFVVSRHRLTMKLANQLVLGGTSISMQILVPPNTNWLGGTSISMQIQKVSLTAFTQKEQNNIFNKSISCHSSISHEIRRSSVASDVDACSQVCENDNASIISCGNSESTFVLAYGNCNKESNVGKRTPQYQTLENCDNLALYKDVPSAIASSTKEQIESPGEALRLQQELKATLAMYQKACEDLVHFKKKAAVLSVECSEESKKVKEALEREDVLKQIATEERAKHLEAIKEVEKARQLLAREALNRHKAEDTASSIAFEKFNLLDSLFLNGKHCRRYSKNEIEAATDYFSNAKKIGEGSYGVVYKCNLDYTPVAVKVLRQDTCDKKEEFIREVEVLSRLRHPHVVLLLGGCPENGCLIYEYMENGSLDDKLFCRDGSTPLPWFIRFRIIFEIACGLAFLHGTKPEPIVHRDLKPGNILLDRNYVSKIGDVGLAMLISDVVPDGLSEYRETIVAGTLYYMDPEYQRTGTIRPKSDLYALGIIALQLLTARHPKGLLMDVENAVESGSVADLLDKSIADWPVVEAEKLAKLALKCSRLRCRERPDLDSEVLPELEELLKAANACLKLRQCDVYVPRQYLCPILQEVMDNPYIAADGYTYEYRAIKAWLGKHKISPVTKLGLKHTCIIPNYSLRSAIREWRSSSVLSTS